MTYCCFFTSSQANDPPDIHVLVNRIKALEERQKPSVSDLKKIVIQYAFRQTCDFDKYKALELIENLKNVAVQCKDKKADYFTTVHAKLLERLSRPADQFKSYILSLLADRDYERIIDAVAKVDRAFSDNPSSNSSPGPGTVVYENYAAPRPYFNAPRFQGFARSHGYQRPQPYYAPPRYRGPRPDYNDHRHRPCDFCGRYNHRAESCFRKRDYERAQGNEKTVQKKE